ncbi:hypothetical protein FIBSPDRAFT_590527 [Athelia psychrophila]|uniref:Uncharacterized protein n=1 Tax=Athelia psychrophila TaxID=1759441 RepID=A0A166H9H8_9AGAM|nr:hypothetical protein FIBSPDRAFT_590527 [Fibularhizoctonia sp. CBS 109695]
MKTRRKSKAESVPAESDQEQDNTRSFDIELPEDIDRDILENILPDVSITSLSSESIVSLYRLLLAQVEEVDATRRDLEESHAEGERKDVELDQALQDKESQGKEFEASLETMQKEVHAVKQEKEQLGGCSFLCKHYTKLTPCH